MKINSLIGKALKKKEIWVKIEKDKKNKKSG